MQPIRLAAALALLAAVPAPAQDRVPLGYAVPDDVHFYVHGMNSQTPDPGWLAFERAVAALAESGIHRDIVELATLDLPDPARRDVRQSVDRVLAALGRVDWPLLFSDEVAFAYRIGLPMPEYVYLFRVPGERAEEQGFAMRAMLADLVETMGLEPTALRDVERGGGTLAILQVPGTPVALATARVEDVVMFSTSARMLSRAVKRVADRDGAGSLVESERFRSSMQLVPAPNESAVYVDLRGLVGLGAQSIRMLSAVVIAQAAAPPQVVELLDSCIGLFEELDVVDHVLATTQSDGVAVTTTTLLRMRPDYADSRFAALFRDREPWTDWDGFVPEDATSFCFDPGLDPAAMLDLVSDMMAETLGGPSPEAVEARAHWLGELRDVLDRVSGEVALVSTPPAGPDGCALGETVLLVRLDDPSGVSEALLGVLERGVALLAERGQHAEVTTVDDVHTLALDAFPWIRPTVRVRGSLLAFATSPAAIDRIERTRVGEVASIRRNPRFRALGIGADDSVRELAYAQHDVPAFGFADVVSGGGFFLSMLPEERDTRHARVLGRILTKLAGALRELSLGYTWGYEGLPAPEPGAFAWRTVYRYRGEH